jgi:hypothetical protein
MSKGGVHPGAGRKKLPSGKKRTIRALKATDSEWKQIKEFADDLKRKNNADSLR